MRGTVLQLNLKIVLIFVSAICLRAARAEDERSIKELSEAIAKLAPDVDAREAELLSATTHTMARRLAREWGVGSNPSYQNFLVNIGARQRGFCAHYVRDIGTRLKEFQFKTLVLHWGAAYAKEAEESNCLVVTARNQPFQNGILMDAWRNGGRLFWCPVRKDPEYEIGNGVALNQLGRHPHSGITAWKEDLQESAWLQEDRHRKVEPKRN